MKSFIKKLYFDIELVKKLRSAKLSKHRLLTMLEAGKINMKECLRAGLENSNQPL
jgi:hypothetical protein